MDWCGGISLRLDCTENELSLCLAFSCGSCALFTGSTSTIFSKKKTLKLGPTQYYSYLKIILQ